MARPHTRRSRAKHAMSLYWRRALAHPTQVFVLIAAALLAVLSVSLTLPLIVFAAGEVILLGVLPRCRWFQTTVDEHEDRVRRARAAETRATLARRLADEHRHELEHLERLATCIRRRSGVDASDGHDAFGLGRLLATYVRLAMAHRSSAEAFRTTNQIVVVDHLTALESMRARSTDANRSSIDRRIAVARRRVEAWHRALAERERIVHDLATIGEIIRWMYEECAATTAAIARTELEDLLTSWQQNGAVVQELSELCEELEGDVDPSVFAIDEPLAEEGFTEGIRIDVHCVGAPVSEEQRCVREELPHAHAQAG